MRWRRRKGRAHGMGTGGERRRRGDPVKDGARLGSPGPASSFGLFPISAWKGPRPPWVPPEYEVMMTSTAPGNFVQRRRVAVCRPWPSRDSSFQTQRPRLHWSVRRACRWVADRFPSSVRVNWASQPPVLLSCLRTLESEDAATRSSSSFFSLCQPKLSTTTRFFIR